MAEIFYIPNGVRNLTPQFLTVNWNNVQDYYVQAIDQDGAVVGTTCVNVVSNCCCDDGVKIHFLNYLGTFDAAGFLKPRVVHEDSSGEFKKSLSYPLEKTDTGIERFNVSSNDTYEAKRKCREDEMTWLQELKDSPKAYMEWQGIEGQPDGYIPITILTGKFEKLKNDREFDYEMVIQFKLSNEYQIIRN